MSRIPPPSITDDLIIAIRAYADAHREPPKGGGSTKPKVPKPALPASAWTVVFDCETTSDAGQALRFGTYQVRNAGELKGTGIIYDPDGVSETEMELLRSHAARHGLELITREQFVDGILYKVGWELNAAIVGFNLPFDISRLAISHGSARTDMRGGFTFKISQQKIFPHIQIKHLSRRAAFIRFAKPMQQPNSRGMRRRGIKAVERRGHFIDIKTLARALFERSFDLAGLSKFLKVESPKLEFDAFAGPITDEMITYAVRDVQATWECYAELLSRFERLGFVSLVPEKVYSAASIGKGYLRDMGILPWRMVQPDFPSQLLANITSTYFGGRSEIGIRRELRQVILVDFLSMYPTVCTLMGLWRFVIAEGMTWQDDRDGAQAFLESVDLAMLQEPDTWCNLTWLVRVKSDADIFPVRACYMAEAQATIGLNCVTSDKPLWFTTADCIASKLLTGKVPEIVEAIRFAPGPVQEGLRPVNISGNPAYRVDPNSGDFFKRVIELRQAVKSRLRDTSGEELDALDTEQNALKIAANSTAYGIYVEVNVAKRGPPATVTVSSSTADPFEFETCKVEEPGPYFHPLLASLICGAARLMLAITESLATNQGLDWAFCDTDSMAIAKPETMAGELFAERVEGIVRWFDALNPYEFGGSILKVEDVNLSLETRKPEPLYCWAISAKRYALFNLTTGGQPIMRKVSAHGLGHLLPPYEDADARRHFPTPDGSVLKDGVKRWHVDLWQAIVLAALAGKPDQVRIEYHPAMKGPAISRYGATSPELLAWFKGYNAGKSYREQVKPFNFLLSMSAGWDARFGERLALPMRGRPSKRLPIKPAAPFDRNHKKALAQTFDRETGGPVLASLLMSHADALAQYHLSPESKFLNGDYLDRGKTRRRHVKALRVRHIGKEADDWERQAILGFDPEAAIDYSVGREDCEIFRELLQAHVDAVGVGQAARALGITRKKVEKLAKANGDKWAETYFSRLAARLHDATKKREEFENAKAAEFQELRVRVERDGLRETARQLSVDPSNLRRRLASAVQIRNLLGKSAPT